MHSLPDTQLLNPQNSGRLPVPYLAPCPRMPSQHGQRARPSSRHLQSRPLAGAKLSIIFHISIHFLHKVINIFLLITFYVFSCIYQKFYYRAWSCSLYMKKAALANPRTMARPLGTGGGCPRDGESAVYVGLI